jgi:triacylglycerol lipase
MPLYITGYSQGGALAVVATYCISNDSVGSGYTFGGPRVGNLLFGQSIRTPVYRVINAENLVPRLPPSYLIEGMTLLLRWLAVIPYNSQIADYLERFHHYRNYAATRNTAETEGMLAAYPGLQVIANPPQISRWIWLCKGSLQPMDVQELMTITSTFTRKNWLTGEYNEI